MRWIVIAAMLFASPGLVQAQPNQRGPFDNWLPSFDWRSRRRIGRDRRYWPGRPGRSRWSSRCDGCHRRDGAICPHDHADGRHGHLGSRDHPVPVDRNVDRNHLHD